MSQNDFNLANQGFPSMRADMNSAFQALASNSSGTTAPSTTYAYQWWYDETNDILKMRNADNDAWIELASFDQAADTWSLLIGGTEMTATAAELNTLDGFTGSTDNLNALDGFTGSTDNLNATQYLSGRNLIINGSGRINQRSYTSGTATSGANEYTLDRWRVVTSGQSLTFTGNDAGRTMTAPAGGVEQVVEGASIVGGTYTISFTGTATCTVDGVTKSSGDTVTLTASTNATVRFTGGTFTDVQLEAGDVATPFEQRPIGTELALCERYFRFVNVNYGGEVRNSFGYTSLADISMRTTPTCVSAGDVVSPVNLAVTSTANFNAGLSGASSAAFTRNATATNAGFYLSFYGLDAEI